MIDVRCEHVEKALGIEGCCPSCHEDAKSGRVALACGPVRMGRTDRLRWRLCCWISFRISGPTEEQVDAIEAAARADV